MFVHICKHVSTLLLLSSYAEIESKKPWFCLCLLIEITPSRFLFKIYAHRHRLKGMPTMISPSYTSKECVRICVWGMDHIGKGRLGRNPL